MRTTHWLLTFRCNLDCRYCWNKIRDVDPDAEVSTERAREILSQMAATGEDQIVFGGGEPLLRRDILELIGHSLAQGMPTTLFSNGLLLDDERAGRLRALADTGPLAIVVSYDGTDRARGSSDGVVAALERLRDRGVTRRARVMVNTVLTRASIVRIDELLDLTVSLGVREHRFDLGVFYPFDAYEGYEDLDLRHAEPAEIERGFDTLCRALEAHRDRIDAAPTEYYRHLQRYVASDELPEIACRAGTGLLGFYPDGKARVCFGRDEVLGDLHTDDFDTIVSAALELDLQRAVESRACATPRCICSFIQYPHRVV